MVYITDLGARYAPLPFEIDGIRRIVDGQYAFGALELLATTYIRVKTHLNNVGYKILSDTALIAQQINLDQTIKKSEEVTQKVEDLTIKIDKAIEEIKQ
jgi:hypothetical protein